jgi:hypothetical protein
VPLSSDVIRIHEDAAINEDHAVYEPLKQNRAKFFYESHIMITTQLKYPKLTAVIAELYDRGFQSPLIFVVTRTTERTKIICRTRIK